MAIEHEPRAIDEVVERIATKYPTLSRELIRDQVDVQLAAFDGSTAGDFVPILVSATPSRSSPSSPRAAERRGLFLRSGAEDADVERRRAMTGFVQIIDFRTSRIDEVRALGDEYVAARAAESDTPVIRVVMTADRDDPGLYLNIVEFDSYELAMENSARPETDAFAAQLAALCDGPPTFVNLDVRFTWDG